ncbi:hypothetical protein FNV43_RR13797 [Rhamnella rubrinervis]|uniref:Receptor-like serine/threonine-protein kinase n=1 Tax=Rhamnella rubrinervis TaxID=2594499 RepID=A0A8K0H1N1_9ROSA|nr:hypothetical protein FNV43_RR13797 [Rhamnella rubrinervis]
MRNTTKSKQLQFFHYAKLLVLISLQTHLFNGSDAIFPDQFLSGNQTIVSQGGNFELGFFKPDKSPNYYMGIWYLGKPTHDKTVVWVANRNRPVSDPFSSAIKLLLDGNLVLFTKTYLKVIWSTNTKCTIPNSTLGVLLDNGNFIIRSSSDSSNIMWQSFDHPTDTWLPGAKLGYHKFLKKKTVLTSWKSSENPAPGPFSIQLEPNGTSIIMVFNGSEIYWTTGDWNPAGNIFQFVTEVVLQKFEENLTYISNENESYFVFSNSHLGLARYVMDFTDGCLRKTPLQCNNGGFKIKFVVISSTRFPLNSQPLITNNINTIEGCESACIRNCSCTAFAYEIDHGTCLIWSGELINPRLLSTENEIRKSIHIRVAASDHDRKELKNNDERTKTKTTIIAIASTILFLTILVLVFLLITWKKRSYKAFDSMSQDSLILFKYQDLRKATNNFSQKLGEGGFGSVFKGTLPNSIDVAVKQLKNLNQCQKQFLSEVNTIGTIHHTNIVRLRGFCAEGSRRFLVYDYMLRGSLESHLFQKGSNLLDWKSRYQIAIGTAKALAYLHGECRNCIIHCDIKPENILLDLNYSPKVADFGLAKLLGHEFSKVLTTIRGTRGYLAPEWIAGGAITPKVDVYSYGKVLFEIISGRRNIDTVNDQEEECDYFPAKVANTIIEGKEVLKLLDCRLDGNADIEELNRACKAACWCIHDDENDRPSMSLVVQMLEGVVTVGIPPMPRYFRLLRGLEDSS